MLLMQNIGAEGVKASIISTKFRNHKIYDTILMEINDEFLPITPSKASHFGYRYENTYNNV